MNQHLIESVLIVGAGWVGRQIAARLNRYGVDVLLFDRDRSTLVDAQRWIEATEPDGEDRATVKVGGLNLLTDLDEVGSDAKTQVDCVLECVPEQLSVKKRVLRDLSSRFPAPTMIASNSSYFVPSMLSRFVEQPERFAHIHFHVPVLHDSVTDIVGCNETSADVIESLRELSERIGLDPLVLRREHPGYVFNWMLQSLLKSALELVALGVVDPGEVDKSWTKVTGMPIGPFGMMDQIGLDVIEQVLANSRWADELEVDAEQLLRLVQQHVKQGDLGTKTGKGFYTYDSDQNLL